MNGDFKDDELIQLLKDFYERTGKIPTPVIVDYDPDMPDAVVFQNRFGSFSNALDKSGLLQYLVCPDKNGK